MRRKNDILWKVVMEEVFDDLLRFLYPDADRVYDLERGFEFLEKELAELYPEPAKGSDTRHVDKLVKVYQRNGKEEWVLPDRFEYVYGSTSLVYKYHAVSILDFADAELEASDNPFASVVMAAKTALLEGKIPEHELLERKVDLAQRLLKKGYSKRKVWAILRFLENYVLFKDQELNCIFRERIRSKNKNNPMGIEEYVKQEGIEIGLRRGRREGKAKGRQEERRALVENLLTETRFSAAKIASLANVTVEFVERVGKGSRILSKLGRAPK